MASTTPSDLPGSELAGESRAPQVAPFSDTNDGTEWNRFVRSHPDGTFFHLSGWRRVLQAEFGVECHYLTCRRDGTLTGVLPLARVRNLLAGDALMSLPFLVYGGPLATDEASCSALCDRARDLADDLGVDYLELRNRQPLSGDWVSKDLYVTFRKRLEPTEEENLKAIPRKQRAVVRKGIKAGLEISTSADIDRFYRVFSESYRNLGTPVFPKSLFHTIHEAFEDACRFVTVSHNGEDVSSVMSFVFGPEILPYYGGNTAGGRAHSASDFMYWTVMRQAVEEGLTVFDYGRSKRDTGSYRFKKHWGFEPEPLAYQYMLVKAKSLPNLSPTNPAFSLPIEIWKRLPVPLTRVIGPPIARRLG